MTTAAFSRNVGKLFSAFMQKPTEKQLKENKLRPTLSDLQVEVHVALSAKGGEPGTIYHMVDIKDRHDSH